MKKYLIFLCTLLFICYCVNNHDLNNEFYGILQGGVEHTHVNVK